MTTAGTSAVAIFASVKAHPDADAATICKEFPEGKVATVCSHLTTLFKRGAVVRKRNAGGKWQYRDASIPWPEGYHQYERPADPLTTPKVESAEPVEVTEPPPPPAEPVAKTREKRPTRDISIPAPPSTRDAMLQSMVRFCGDLGRSMGDMILDACMQRVHEGVEQAFNEFENKSLPKFDAAEAIQAITSVPPSAAPRKRKVLIIGVSHSQTEKLDREFDACLKLSYWRIDQMDSLRSGAAACQKLRDMMKGADFVFEMSRVSNDKVSDIAKQVGVKPEWCTGGMLMLRDQLTSVYASA